MCIRDRGCPVAAVRASGVVDVVRQGINGYMTEEAPEAFAAAAARLVLERGVWSGTVSYKHLDLYKRQVPGRYSSVPI